MKPTSSMPFAWALLAVLALAAGCSKHDRAARALERGDKYLAAEQYDLAEDAYQIALSILPEDSRALGKLGMMCQRQGKFVPGYLLLQRALKEDPKNVELQLSFGLVAQGLAKTLEARAAARRVLEAQPTNERGLLLLAETCVTTRDSEEARTIIQGLRAGQLDAAGYHLALGVLGIVQRDQTAAETELRQALQLNPKSSAAHFYLGSLLVARSDVAQGGASLRTAAELEPLRSTRRMHYIEHLLQTGAVEEAKKLLAEVTTKAPDYIPGLKLEMSLAHKERRYEESGSIADKILKRDATNHDALSQRAAAKIALGNIEGGISALKMMEEIYAQSPLVKFRLAHAHLRKSEFVPAVDYLGQAIRLAPDYDDAILLLAETNLNRGNATTALSSLRELIKRQPRLVRAYLLLAQAHHVLGETEQCIGILRSFTDAFPKSPDGHYFLARVFAEIGKKDESRRALEQCVQAAPSHWPAVEMLVNNDLLANRTDAAKTRVKGLLESFPKQPVPLMLDAKVALQERDEKRAEANLQKAIELAPNEPQAYLFLSRVYLASQQPAQAVETLSALAEKTKDARTFMQLGVLNGALGHHDGARVAYEKALAVDPTFVPALNNLAAVLSVRLGQIANAQGHAEKARELAPTDPHVSDTLGWIFFLKGQYEMALPLIRASAEKMPAEALVQYHLGMVHYRLGNEEQATQAFRQVATDRVEPAIWKSAQDHLALLAIDGATAGADIRRELEGRLARDSHDPVVLARVAAIEAREGSREKAIGHYEAALKISPRSIAMLSALVDLHAAPAGNPARALELAKSAHALAPYQHELAWKLGRVALRLGDSAWAATALRSAANSLRDRPGLFLDLARANFGAGRVAEAERALQDGLGLAGSGELRTELTEFATLIAASGSPERSFATLAVARKVLAADPENSAALLVSALAQEHAKDSKAAAQTCEKILSSSPSFVPAMRLLAILLADKLGDDKKAEEIGAKAVRALPNDPELAFSLGTISFRRGDYAEAVRLLRISGRNRDQHAETFFHLGMAEYQLKNTTESLVQLQRALRLGLPPMETNEAKKLLEHMSRAGASLRP